MGPLCTLKLTENLIISRSKVKKKKGKTIPVKPRKKISQALPKKI